MEKVLENAKEIDDKRLLVEGHLLESKLIYESNNLQKAKASLTACRASANLVYIQPLLQADIEVTAGMIHLAEKDYQIAYSYFFEAFEAYNQSKISSKAAELFTYLILSKLMQDSINDSENLIKGRYGELYRNFDVYTKIIQEILEACKMKSLVMLSKILKNRKKEIKQNGIISSQIDYLYDQLLKKNILKLIMPYSKIEVTYLSQKLGVGEPSVERKICEMILDKSLLGSLDQENGILIISENSPLKPIYTDSLEILNNMDGALDALFERAKQIKSY